VFQVCDEPQGGEDVGDGVSGRLLDGDQVGGDGADGKPIGPLLHQDDNPVGQDGGVDQLPRIIVRRKFRLKDGISRDGLLQLGVKTFARTIVKHSGGGGSSDQGKLGSTEDSELVKNVCTTGSGGTS
jgi:hypothetical protein